MAAKFSPESLRGLPGSSLLATVCECTSAALQEHPVGVPGSSSWTGGLPAERFPEPLMLVRRLLAKCRRPPEWSLAERQKYVRLLHATDHDLEGHVSEWIGEGPPLASC